MGSWKNPSLEGGSWKNNIKGGLPIKRGLGQFADLRGAGLGKKEGGWEGGGVDTPMHTVITWEFFAQLNSCNN